VTCRICHNNEVNNSSGICWECFGKRFSSITPYAEKKIEQIHIEKKAELRTGYYRETHEGDIRGNNFSQEIFINREWQNF